MRIHVLRNLDLRNLWIHVIFFSILRIHVFGFRTHEKDPGRQHATDHESTSLEWKSSDSYDWSHSICCLLFLFSPSVMRCASAGWAGSRLMGTGHHLGRGCRSVPSGRGTRRHDGVYLWDWNFGYFQYLIRAASPYGMLVLTRTNHNRGCFGGFTNCVHMPRNFRCVSSGVRNWNALYFFHSIVFSNKQMLCRPLG